jgi:glutathione S-transferase
LTVTVYHLSESRSERIVWLLEELSTPYQLVEFKRLVPSMEAPPEYRALHPMGTSPMIGDDGQILIESGTIVEYILERYGSGRLVPPRKTPEHTRYLQWMHFSEGMAMSGLMNEGLLLMNGADPAQSSILGSLRRRNDRMMDYIDGELGRSRYFAGDEFSAADIMMTFMNAQWRAPIRMVRTGDSQVTYRVPSLQVVVTTCGLGTNGTSAMPYTSTAAAASVSPRAKR